MSERFGISESDAALLITATMLPLAIAPLSYGYLLEAVPAMRVLRWSLVGLAISELAFVLVDSFI
ncbi:MAG: MFS transporter, partial [Chloroflexaceae bacterium]|nr:MFS transporter [Chloroflexaceae bacterium]